VQGFLFAENPACRVFKMQQKREKAFFSVPFIPFRCFKKQGPVRFFAFIFRFVKCFQLFICFFETFSAFLLLSNPPESFIIIKRSVS